MTSFSSEDRAEASRTQSPLLISASPESRASPTAHFLAAMSPYIASLLPHLLWFVALLVTLMLFGESVRKLADRASLSKVGLGPLEIRFAEQAALNIQGKDGAFKTPKEFKPIADRAQLMAEQLQGSHILWVDDNNPSQNVQERRVLEAFGIRFDLSASTNDALKWLERAHYDVVISDVRRDSDPTNPTSCVTTPEPYGAGCALAAEIEKRFAERAPPIILYVARYPKDAGRPSNVFGLTNRTDELFNLVLDALARRPSSPQSTDITPRAR